MITLEDAKNLSCGDTLHHKTFVNADGTPMRFKVTGVPKTWKRNTSRVRVPLKHGLYDYGELTNDTFEGGGFTLHLHDVVVV